jgi:hypothetical protein
MKNKKSIYVLLPLVLLIWGAIIYQFFNYANPEPEVIPTQDPSVRALVIKPKESISIKINPRDPFSGKMVDNAARKATGNHNPNKKLKIKEPLVWPLIRYKGIVSDNKDKIKVYMVIIDGKTYLMKKGETEEGIQLKDGNRDNINLVYEGSVKDFLIQ